MGGILGKPKTPDIPPPPAPPPVPKMDDAMKNAQDREAALRRQGRAAALMSGSKGDLSAPNVGTKTLLGG